MNGTNGFRVDGVVENAQLGTSLDGVGDVNGDGFDDILISAPRGELSPFPNFVASPGYVYLIYGKSGGFAASIAVDSLDVSSGVTIAGPQAESVAGQSVSGAGDFDGDGFDDLIIGVPGPIGVVGSSYVVFGAANLPASINLAEESQAVRIRSSQPRPLLPTGRVVGGAGDWNGDGFDDVLTNDSSSFTGGGAYVVFGSSSASESSIDLASLNGQNGFVATLEAGGVIPGFRSSPGARSLVSAGDLNGDGVDDFGPQFRQKLRVFGWAGICRLWSAFPSHSIQRHPR